MKKNSAITLISLVITIVLLIILVSVVINISIGENGLLNKAKGAKENYIIATNEELEKIANIDIDTILNEENKSKLTLASQITANNYGEKINYNVNGINDWKIFYKDENDEVFIIASKYLPANKLPVECGFGTYSSEYPYRAYWEVAPSFTERWENSKKLFKAEFYTLNPKYDNSKCVATLLNTENWNSFVNSNYADLAIGTPTLEMWCKSWNEKGYTQLEPSANRGRYWI